MRRWKEFLNEHLFRGCQILKLFELNETDKENIVAIKTRTLLS